VDESLKIWCSLINDRLAVNHAHFQFVASMETELFADTAWDDDLVFAAQFYAGHNLSPPKELEVNVKHFR